MLNPIPYSDGISKDPHLNFTLYAKQLLDIAMRVTENQEGAFTVGIFGSWGSGKTTLMRQIESQASASQKTIWFNSWKYDKKEAVWNALIQTILVELENNTRDNKVLNEDIKRLAKNIGLHAYDISKELFTGLIRTQIKKYTDVELSQDDLKLPQDQLRELDLIKALSDHYTAINEFETNFNKIVQAYLGEDKNKKLFVFIDDLDRCLPENALAVLEALKLYLDQSRCVFFIGIDKRVIEQAVSQRYKDSTITGKEYVEKIIQLNFFLPDKDSQAVKSVLKDTLYEIAPAEDDIWDMLLIATKGNLRRSKQFIIAWYLVKNIAIDLKIEQNLLPKLAKVLLIQIYFPDLYDMLPTLNFFFMSKLIQILNAQTKKSETDQFNNLLEQYPDCKKFIYNSDLNSFLRRGVANNFDPDISDSKELKTILNILSQSGRASISNQNQEKP
ncbi:P-loop NTPase fold protein [Floridanema aerugineum]|uniref:P-loop NTPase fold protein n=1 Tax=Floridaenema aerugineum BLCC-F46 TaxID=3153654 RepID=A0ABV4X278_9CYAN